MRLAKPAFGLIALALAGCSGKAVPVTLRFHSRPDLRPPVLTAAPARRDAHALRQWRRTGGREAVARDPAASRHEREAGDPPCDLGEPRPGPAATLYASWNGATGVARWEVLAGLNADNLSPVGRRMAKTGFETKLVASTIAPLLAVEALDAAGNVIARSAAVARGGAAAG